MGCEELCQLFTVSGWQEDESILCQIAIHIRACLCCRYGLVHLSQELFDSDPLNCEECLALLPDYYETTRLEYPLVKMEDKEVVQVALHLGHCAACCEVYQELVLLSELEERDELVD